MQITNTDEHHNVTVMITRPGLNTSPAQNSENVQVKHIFWLSI